MINNKHIVLIEDKDDICFMLTRLFSSQNDYEFLCTSSEKANLKEVLITVQDLIIINEDNLEDTTVTKLIKQIRKNKDNAIIPIIVVSSKEEQEHKLEVLKCGVEHYIHKPINEQYFYYTIKNISHLISSNRCISALTQLPGNIQIENELKRRIASKKLFSVLYVDLDNFKAYNDKYGFMNGDEVIKFTAETIKNSIQKFGKNGDFLGHIGGDDFVAIVDYENSKKIGRDIIKEFEKRIVYFYNEEDLKKGSIKILNRKGKLEKYPIMTITVAMVSNRYRKYSSVLELGEDGASVKKKAKAILGSTFLEDRRKS